MKRRKRMGFLKYPCEGVDRKGRTERKRSYNRVSVVEERRVVPKKLLKGEKITGLSTAMDGGGLGRSGAVIQRPLHISLSSIPSNLSKSKKGRKLRGEKERERERFLATCFSPDFLLTRILRPVSAEKLNPASDYCVQLIRCSLSKIYISIYIVFLCLFQLPFIVKLNLRFNQIGFCRSPFLLTAQHLHPPSTLITKYFD